MQVKLLVAFLIENTDDIIAEEVAGLEETPAPTDTSTGMSRNRGLSKPGTQGHRNLSIKKTSSVGLPSGLSFSVLVFQEVVKCRRLWQAKKPR